MERRKFISGAGMAGILAAGFAPVAQANQAIRWRLASRLPKIMDVPHAGVQAFIRQVKELSGGKFEISLFASDELAAGVGVLEGVQRGQVECGHTSATYYIDKDETFAIDSALPFGLDARQTTAWLLHGNGLNLLREFYKGLGVVNFPMGNTGAQMGGWYRKAPRNLAELKGLRMRMAGLGARVFERLGGKPVYLSSNETFNALQHNSLDAAEWGCPHDDLKLGLHDLCRFYAYPGWWRGGAQFSLYINRRAYDALTDENQAIVEAAATAAHLDILAQYDSKNPLALRELIATGTQLATMPKPVLDAAWKVSQELFAEIAAKNPPWRKIHASYAAFQKAQAWNQAEQGFANYVNERQQQQLAAEAKAQKKAQKSAPARRR